MSTDGSIYYMGLEGPKHREALNADQNVFTTLDLFPQQRSFKSLRP